MSVNVEMEWKSNWLKLEKTVLCFADQLCRCLKSEEFTQESAMEKLANQILTAKSQINFNISSAFGFMPDKNWMDLHFSESLVGHKIIQIRQFVQSHFQISGETNLADAIVFAENVINDLNFIADFLLRLNTHVKVQQLLCLCSTKAFSVHDHKNLCELTRLGKIGSFLEPELRIQVAKLEAIFFQRSYLHIVKQPSSILSTVNMTVDDGSSRPGRKAKSFNTRTELSLHVLNLFGQITPQTMDLKLYISLIDEPYAQEIEQNGLPSIIETKNRINCKQASPVSGHVLQLKFENGYTPTSLNVTISDISIVHVERQKKKYHKTCEERYYFLVIAELKQPPKLGDFSVNAWTLSLPIHVCTHSIQMSDTLAASFSIVRSSSLLPEKKRTANIFEIIEFLSAQLLTKISSFNNSEHKQFLENMLLDDMCQVLGKPKEEIRNQIPLDDFFRKITSSQHAFSFWDWFQGVVKLFKFQFLQDLYENGHFEAFISKEEAQRKLLEPTRHKQAGDFILRLSQGRLEEISVAVLAPNLQFIVVPMKTNNHSNQTFQQSFIEFLNTKLKSGKNTFNNLYPNLPKETVFPQLLLPQNSGIRLGYTPICAIIQPQANLESMNIDM